MQKLRLRYGLFWRNSSPSIKPLLKVALLTTLLVFAASCAIKHERQDDELANLMQEHKIAEQKFRDQLDVCLNGGIVGRSGNTVLLCDRVHELNFGKLELVKRN